MEIATNLKAIGSIGVWNIRVNGSNAVLMLYLTCSQSVNPINYSQIFPV